MNPPPAPNLSASCSCSPVSVLQCGSCAHDTNQKGRGADRLEHAEQMHTAWSRRVADGCAAWRPCRANPPAAQHLGRRSERRCERCNLYPACLRKTSRQGWGGVAAWAHVPTYTA